MRRAIKSNKFWAFRIGVNQLQISHLLFVDDTLIMREASFENLWTMKSTFHCYKLISGLKVNFH